MNYDCALVCRCIRGVINAAVEREAFQCRFSPSVEQLCQGKVDYLGASVCGFHAVLPLNLLSVDEPHGRL